MQLGLTVFGRTLEFRTKQLVPLRPLSEAGWGWWPIIRESFTGAWQQNQEIRSDTALGYWAVFACVTLIAADIGKTIGGKTGSSVGRAIVRGTMGGILRR